MNRRSRSVSGMFGSLLEFVLEEDCEGHESELDADGDEVDGVADIALLGDDDGNPKKKGNDDRDGAQESVSKSR